MRSLVAWYSRTGNTRAVADAIAARLDDPRRVAVTPTRERSYPNWLLRSFVPGSRVAIEPLDVDPGAFDAVLIGAPKWTVSCPPINEALARLDLAGCVVAPFITYGGFDEARYVRGLAARLRDAGAIVPATLRVRRDAIGGDDLESGVETFLAIVSSAVG